METAIQKDNGLTDFQKRWVIIFTITFCALMFLCYLRDLNLGLSIKAAETRSPAFSRVMSHVSSLQQTVHRMGTVDIKSLPMHPNVKEYIYQFKGKVTCGKSPCQAGKIKIQLNSQHNLPIAKAVPIEPDGTYLASVSVDEVPHEEVGWQIDAENNDGATSEVDGMQILDDDNAPVTLDKTIQL
jgi:hypothetical protein